jgi:hypothetical protein
LSLAFPESYLTTTPLFEPFVVPNQFLAEDLSPYLIECINSVSAKIAFPTSISDLDEDYGFLLSLKGYKASDLLPRSTSIDYSLTRTAVLLKQWSDYLNAVVDDATLKAAQDLRYGSFGEMPYQTDQAFWTKDRQRLRRRMSTMETDPRIVGPLVALWSLIDNTYYSFVSAEAEYDAEYQTIRVRLLRRTDSDLYCSSVSVKVIFVDSFMSESILTLNYTDLLKLDKPEQSIVYGTSEFIEAGRQGLQFDRILAAECSVIDPRYEPIIDIEGILFQDISDMDEFEAVSVLAVVGYSCQAINLFKVDDLYDAFAITDSSAGDIRKWTIKPKRLIRKQLVTVVLQIKTETPAAVGRQSLTIGYRMK